MVIISFFPKELQDVAALCLAFGLRRKELTKLQYKDITVTEEKTTIQVRRFNNHQPCTVKANKIYEPAFRKVLHQKGAHNPEDLFIDHEISKHLDIHHFRVDAAKAIYKELELEGTLSRVEILKKVAKFLGHNSIEIVIKYYLM